MTLAFALLNNARGGFQGGQYLARAMGDPQPPTDQIWSSSETLRKISNTLRWEFFPRPFDLPNGKNVEHKLSTKNFKK